MDRVVKGFYPAANTSLPLPRQAAGTLYAIAGQQICKKVHPNYSNSKILL